MSTEHSTTTKVSREEHALLSLARGLWAWASMLEFDDPEDNPQEVQRSIARAELRRLLGRDAPDGLADLLLEKVIDHGAPEEAPPAVTEEVLEDVIRLGVPDDWTVSLTRSVHRLAALGQVPPRQIGYWFLYLAARDGSASFSTGHCDTVDELLDEAGDLIETIKRQEGI